VMLLDGARRASERLGYRAGGLAAPATVRRPRA